MDKLKRTKGFYEFCSNWDIKRESTGLSFGGPQIKYRVFVKDEQLPELIEVLQRCLDTGSFVEERYRVEESAYGPGTYVVLDENGYSVTGRFSKGIVQEICDLLNKQEEP